MSSIFQNAWKDLKNETPKELMILLGAAILLCTPLFMIFDGLSILQDEYDGLNSVPYLFLSFILALIHNILLLTSIYLPFLPAGYVFCLTSRFYMNIRNSNTKKMSEIYLLPALVIFIVTASLIILLSTLMFEISNVGWIIEDLSFLNIIKN